MKVTRSELRQRIMTILYQVYIYKKDNISYNLTDIIKENDKENNTFVKDIVEGVLEDEKKLDLIINNYLTNWEINRLGNIDKAIFRMGTYELLYTNTPHIVSINEAIELSKLYSDEKVTKMLNACLDNILNNEVINE